MFKQTRFRWVIIAIRNFRWKRFVVGAIKLDPIANANAECGGPFKKLLNIIIYIIITTNTNGLEVCLWPWFFVSLSVRHRLCSYTSTTVTLSMCRSLHLCFFSRNRYHRQANAFIPLFSVWMWLCHFSLSSLSFARCVFEMRRAFFPVVLFLRMRLSVEVTVWWHL